MVQDDSVSDVTIEVFLEQDRSLFKPHKLPLNVVMKEVWVEAGWMQKCKMNAWVGMSTNLRLLRMLGGFFLLFFSSFWIVMMKLSSYGGCGFKATLQKGSKRIREECIALFNCWHGTWQTPLIAQSSWSVIWKCGSAAFGTRVCCCSQGSSLFS